MLFYCADFAMIERVSCTKFYCLNWEGVVRYQYKGKL